MCICKQKSKKPAGTPGNFNYVFTCTKDDGTKTEIKVTSGNDNEAKQLAELECDESKAGSLLKVLRKFDSQSTGTFYSGYKYPDNNLPGHILLVESSYSIYSFNKNDILNESQLPNGKVYLEIRNGSSAYLSNPFLVGKEEVNFQNITDNLVAEGLTPRKGDPRLATKKDIEALKKLKPLARTLASVATFWNNSCNLSDVEGNNCAHFLSDAFIRAGYTELRKAGDNPNISLWCDWNVTTKSDNARPVRAFDMKNWFNSMASKKERTIQSNNGFWAVYQERQSDGQGHVLLYDSNNKVVYGTVDTQTGNPYFFSSWLQFFYQW